MPLLIRRGPDQFDLMSLGRINATLIGTLTRRQVVRLARQCDELLREDEQAAVELANRCPDSHAACSDVGHADTWGCPDPPAQPQGDGTAGDTDPGDCDEMVVVDSDDDSA